MTPFETGVAVVIAVVCVAGLALLTYETWRH